MRKEKEICTSCFRPNLKKKNLARASVMFCVWSLCLYVNTLKECDDGTYGYDCIDNCSGHCLNNFPCNKQTGHCDRRCKHGYTNSKCSKGQCTILVIVCVKYTLAWLIVFTIFIKEDSNMINAFYDVSTSTVWLECPPGLDSLDRTAKNVVAAIVWTMNHVTMSVACVLVVARMGTLGHYVIIVRCTEQTIDIPCIKYY